MLASLVFIINAQTLSKQEIKVKKAYMSDTTITRYSKNIHTLNATPIFLLYLSNFTNTKSIFGLGAEIGYGYFPVNNWLLGTNLSYVHMFSNPKNQGNAYNFSLLSKYYFFPKKSFSFFIGLEGQLTYFNYKTKAETPEFLYYNDAITNDWQSHLLPIIRPVAGISWKVMKNLSIQALIGYTHSFYSKEGTGNSILQKGQQYAYLTYHFNRKTKAKKITSIPIESY